MNASLALGIALAAAIGAPARFLVDRWVTRAWAARRLRPDSGGPAGPWPAFPWGLLVVNALGSLIAGSVLVLASSMAQTVLLVGLCGAFTTFSGFGWDLARLWQHARASFWTTLTVMPTGCIAAFGLGWGFGYALAG